MSVSVSECQSESKSESKRESECQTERQVALCLATWAPKPPKSKSTKQKSHTQNE